MVRWKGLPGWTAFSMVDYDNDASVRLWLTLHRICSPSVLLVIILAGTNNVGAFASSMNDADVNLAVEPIL